MAESENTNFFTNKLYDKLKFLALVLLPALGTLWFSIAGLWGIPHTTEVVGTLVAIDTFLGVVLHISTSQYYKNGSNFDGTLNVTDEEEPQLLVQLNGPPQDIPGKHSVEFNVHKVPTA